MTQEYTPSKKCQEFQASFTPSKICRELWEILSRKENSRILPVKATKETLYQLDQHWQEEIESLKKEIEKYKSLYEITKQRLIFVTERYTGVPYKENKIKELEGSK